MRRYPIGLLTLFLAHCAESSTSPTGIATSERGSGPEVVFDLAGRPLPEIPFPNDLATRKDDTSPTGKRLNASLFASTAVEQELREQLNSLDGFGTYSAITVKFSKPLDLPHIVALQQQDPIKFDDDAIYVVNLNPNSPNFGKPVPLDLGQGNFPVTLEQPDAYFPNDPRGTSNNLLFETTEEDLNQNGKLDPGEDTDFDGVLDHPNTITPDGDPDTDLATFYERQTNTLILRPMVPLEEQTTYAVIVTKRLIGEDESPVQSPFPYINHVEQNEALAPLVSQNIFTDLGLNFSTSGGGDVAFVWSFTTQTITRDLTTIRDGLYADGPFARLSSEFPVSDIKVDQLIDSGATNLFVLPAERLVPLLPQFADILNVPAEGLDSLSQSFDFVDYMVTGSFISPSFMADQLSSDAGYIDEADQLKPLDANEIVRRSFDIDYQNGTGRIGRDRVSFMMAVPKPTPEHQGPFPVVMFMHGYGSNRLQALGFAGNLARHGFATVGIELVGHGLGVSQSVNDGAEALLSLQQLGSTWRAVTNGRQRDLNGDDVGDSGGDFFSGYPFHTRDNIRQTVVDAMQMMRILRSFDGVTRWDFDLNGDGQNELAGDLNADGVVDLGGENNKYFAFGESAGGIIVEVLGGVEPKLSAIAEAASTGGLSDSGMRSLAIGIRESTVLRSMGPLFLGLPNAETGDFELVENIPDLRNAPQIAVAKFDTLPKEGDTVIVNNLETNDTASAGVTEGGLFRVAVRADKGDPIEVIVIKPDGGERTRIDTIDRDFKFEGESFKADADLVALGDGFGLQRNTPDFRKLFAISQMVFDAGDPINYAPHLFTDPLYVKLGDKELSKFLHPNEGTPIPVKLLHIPTIGDTSVPIATGLGYARAAGVLNFTDAVPAYDSLDNDDSPGVSENGILLQMHVYEGMERFLRLASAPFFDPREILGDPDNLSESTECLPEYCLVDSCRSVVTDEEVGAICQGDPATFKRAPKLADLGLPPLRATRNFPDGTVSGLRLPYLKAKGEHAFAFPRPTQAFDVESYLIHLIGRYFASDATNLAQDLCLEDASCPGITQLP